MMRSAAVKFSEEVVPLGEMKVNPGKIVRRVDETGRPVLLTSHGRGVAVVQALYEYEAAQEERDFMRAVVAGLADIEAGRVMSLDEVVRSLGLE
jgi:prevent-host-death family protein